MAGDPDNERTLTDADLTAMVAALSAGLEAQSRYSRTVRDENHEWALGRRNALHENQTRRQRIVEKVAGGGILFGIVSFFGFVGHAFIAWITRLVNGGVG